MPFAITVGLNTTSKDHAAATTIEQSTYGKIILPFAGSPFKFVIEPERSVTSKAFIIDKKQISVPYYNVLRLNYSNMPVGIDRGLVGRAKNIGPFDLHDVSICLCP